MGPALLCLATLFSCKNESLIPEDNADDMIEMPVGPSDDALAVTMDKKVYVFPMSTAEKARRWRPGPPTRFPVIQASIFSICLSVASGKRLRIFSFRRRKDSSGE